MRILTVVGTAGFTLICNLPPTLPFGLDAIWDQDSGTGQFRHQGAVHRRRNESPCLLHLDRNSQCLSHN